LHEEVVLKTTIVFKYSISDYVKIKPLEGYKGRVVSQSFDGYLPTYKIEYWDCMEQKYCFLLEDELELDHETLQI